jgi:hypothetical protein
MGSAANSSFRWSCLQIPVVKGVMGGFRGFSGYGSLRLAQNELVLGRIVFKPGKAAKARA